VSFLARATAPRATKGIEQESMATIPGSVYVPIENRSTWSMDWLPAESRTMAIATFYAGVRVLAETFAMLPLLVYRRLEGGGKERATDHPLYEVLHDAPNPEMSSFIWRELVMQNLVTWGNHFSEIVEDRLGRIQLWPMRPDRMEVSWGPDSRKRYVYSKANGERTLMRPGSVFHVPGMGADGLKGYSLLSLHRKTFDLHDAARDFGESTFRNNARPAIVLSHPKKLSEGAIIRLAGQMDALKGSRNAGKTVVMEEGLQLHEVGIPPKDAQFLESRVFQKREIATLLRIQAHKVNDLERATFSNIAEQQIEFMQDTMTPWFSRFEGEGNRQLLPFDDEHFIAFLITGYLRGNPKDRAEALQIRRQNGTITADEWRELEDENPLPDGTGKTFWMPVNMRPTNPPVEGDEQGEEEVTEEPSLDRPVLTAVRSAAIRCTGTYRDEPCNRLLAEVATPPYRFTCSRCKGVTEAA
jgi:HK97 family phage portal protein